MGEMDRKIREAEEDEMTNGIGILSRCASQTAARRRRQSKQLETEFIQLMSERLEAIFHHFDADGNGTLDAAELATAFEAAGRPSDEETIKAAIEALDENNDGLI